MENLETKKRILMNINLRVSPHILETIFSKLSISNLPACRLVSKTWNNLILDYTSSTKFLPIPNTLFLFIVDKIIPDCNNPSSKSCVWCNPKIHCIDIDHKMSVAAASFVFEGDWSYVNVTNSCNGLLYICKFTLDSLCEGVLNPMTNEFMEVPQPEIQEDIHCYGFGFSPQKKQYKLFRVAPEDPKNLKNCHAKMEIFTFGNHKQWRHFECLPFQVYYHGAYLNGVIYWTGRKKIRKENDKILLYALDVETEKMEWIATLEIDPSLRIRTACIEICNDCVYAIIYLMDKLSSSCMKIEVWRMRNKDSWIKEFSIDDIKYFCLIKVFEDGELLYTSQSDLFRLDKTGRKIKIKTLNPNERRVGLSSCNINSLNFESLSNIFDRR